MTNILNTADPTIVPTPTSPFVMKTPETKEESDGENILKAENIKP